MVDIAAAVLRKVAALGPSRLAKGNARYFSYKLECRSEATPENYRKLIAEVLYIGFI